MIGYAISELIGALSRGRLRTLMAISTVSIAMFIFTGFFFASENITRGMDRFRSAAKIEVILSGQADHVTVIGKFLSLPGVARAEYFSRQRALEYFTETLGEDLARGISDALGANPFPAFIEIHLEEGILHPEEIANRIEEIEGVAEVIYGRETARRWETIAGMIQKGAYGIGAVMAIFTVLIVINNVRLSALSRVHDIYVMRLVGASNGYLLAPFVLEGAFIGLTGTILGGGAVFAMWRLFAPHITYLRIEFLPDLVVASILVLGVSVGALGGFFAVRENIGATADEGGR